MECSSLDNLFDYKGFCELLIYAAYLQGLDTEHNIPAAYEILTAEDFQSFYKLGPDIAGANDGAEVASKLIRAGALETGRIAQMAEKTFGLRRGRPLQSSWIA